MMYIKMTLLKACIFLGLLVMVLTKGSPPTFVREPQKKYTVREGGKVRLKCVPTGHNDPIHNRTLIVWMKKATDSKPDIIRRKKLKWDRFKVKNGKNLLIRDVQKQDAGRYVCRAQNQHGWAQAVIDLEVVPRSHLDATESLRQSPKPTDAVKAPQFRNQQSSDRSAKQKSIGHTLKLPCQAKGDPKPNISWFKDNKPLKKTKGRRMRKNVLIIRKLKLSDSGVFKCLVWNKHGNITRTFFVQVIGNGLQADTPKRDKPKRDTPKPRIQESLLRNATVKEGESVTFTCAAISHRTPEFAWVKWIKLEKSSNFTMTYKVLNSSEPNVRFVRQASTWAGGGMSYSQKLKLLNVTRRDSGQYSCFVGNDGKSIVSSHVYLTVQESTTARRSAKTTAIPPITVDSFQFPLAAIISIPLAFITLCIVAIIWCIVQTMKHRKQFNAAALQPTANGVSALNYLQTRENGHVIYAPRPEERNVQLPEETQSRETQSHVMNGFHMSYGREVSRNPEMTQRPLRNEPESMHREQDKIVVTPCVTRKDEIPEIRITDTGVYPIRNVYSETPPSNSSNNSNNNIRTSVENSPGNSSKSPTFNRPSLPQETQLHKEAYSDCSFMGNDDPNTDFDNTYSHIDDYGVKNSVV